MSAVCLVLFSACDDQPPASSAPGSDAAPEVLMAPVDDQGEPMIVQRVTVVGGKDSDPTLVSTVRAMVWKRVNERPDLEWAEFSDERMDVTVVVGCFAAADMNAIADRAGAVVVVGDVVADPIFPVAHIGADPEFSAGQIGEAVRAMADGNGRVVMAPVLATNPSAAARIAGVLTYLKRVAPANNKNGVNVVVPDTAMQVHDECSTWLNHALTRQSVDRELSAVVGVTRAATDDALLRMRAVGLATSVPLIGYGIDNELIRAIDAGELAGVFVFDPGTLEASLRVAVDRAAGVKLGGPAAPTVEHVVPLRWLDHSRLGSPSGRMLAAPYLHQPAER